MSDIKLNFINQSNDQNNSEIVIFQHNVATDFDEIAVAWKVIKNCGIGDNHPFVYPMLTQINASDSYGNMTSLMNATVGDEYHMVLAASGDELRYKGPGVNSKEITIANDLEKGTIDANCYKDGKLLATKTGILPGQKAAFQFTPNLYIGVASQIEEGQVMNSAILSDINTELNLLGIASADIVMTGGGTGPTASPFQFELENVVMA